MQSFNNRILILYFSGNPATTIIIQYAPVEGSTDAENHHYQNLSSVINDSPKLNVLIVHGDFNAHIGNRYAQHTYHKDTNSNRQHLLDLALERNLVITNTTFQKKSGTIWTYLSDMTGHKSQIDSYL